ncbi:hypothetical protein G7Y89_g11389 [Cudoniella acicularis]|uniref:Uncharacterized protein n=1 Tax=Cudoniella acicularis TaxID=354080 RepID=A0A8H4REK7_9HELO|nr:hypothetical protein G7Y89_g11389 [Cudoniella acicularis]
MSLDTYNEQPRFKDILQQLPDTLQLQLQLVTILARAHKTFVELGLLTMTLQQKRALDFVLRMLSSQINSIESNAASEWDYFYIAAARQEINAMHFFKSSHTLDAQSCNSVFSTTAKVLKFCGVDGSFAYATHSQRPIATNVDQEHGSILFLATAKFMQSCYVEKGDLPNRASLFAEQLLGNEKLFKDTNGTVNIALRVRNRLSASPLRDVIIRWREEFRDLGTQAAPSRKAELLNHAANFSGSFSSSINPNDLTTNIFAESNPLLTNELWGDLGLDLNDTWGFPGSNTDWTA